MWTNYQPIKNEYFWAGIVLLMLVVVYGFWGLAASRNTGSEAARETNEILMVATNTKQN